MNDGYTRPDWRRSVLLTIDVQRDFILPNDMLALEGTEGPIRTMGGLTRAFRSAGLPIVHVIRLYKTDGSNVDACRRAMIESGGRIAVPGSLEIPLALSLALATGFVGRAGRHRGCVALGCVIRGETTHYDIVARESAAGLHALASGLDVSQPER